MSYHTLSHDSCHVLPSLMCAMYGHIFSYLAMSYRVLSSLIIPYHTFSYIIMHCYVLSHLSSVVLCSRVFIYGDTLVDAESEASAPVTIMDSDSS